MSGPPTYRCPADCGTFRVLGGFHTPDYCPFCAEPLAR